MAEPDNPVIARDQAVHDHDRRQHTDQHLEHHRRNHNWNTDVPNVVSDNAKPDEKRGWDCHCPH